MNKRILFNVLIFCLPFFALAQNDVSLFDQANALFKQNKSDQSKVFIDKGLEESPLDSE